MEEEEEENYSLQSEPTWEHKALFGTDSVLYARCKSILWEAPEKGETLAKVLNLERSDFVFDASRTRFAQGELISGSAAI